MSQEWWSLYYSCHWVRDKVHPGPVASPLHCHHIAKPDKQPYTATFGEGAGNSTKKVCHFYIFGSICDYGSFSPPYTAKVIHVTAAGKQTHQQAHCQFLVSGIWLWSHDCDNYNCCVLLQIQFAMEVNDDVDSAQPKAVINTAHVWQKSLCTHGWNKLPDLEHWLNTLVSAQLFFFFLI